MRRAVFDWAKRFNIIQDEPKNFRFWIGAYLSRDAESSKPSEGCGLILDDNVQQGTKTSESPICKCLKGSVPKSHEEWSKGNRTAGCVRKTKLFCESSTQVSQSLRAENELGFRRWYG
ncbi:unnamed protein product [Prunus armeniaca]